MLTWHRFYRLNKYNEKVQTAMTEFSEMFPNLDPAMIEETLQKNDGNSERTLNELLCAT